MLLEANAKLILNDSGGSQEKACILKISFITLRDNTERPEPIEVGANVLGKVKPKNIYKYSTETLTRERLRRNLFRSVGCVKMIFPIVDKLIKNPL